MKSKSPNLSSPQDRLNSLRDELDKIERPIYPEKPATRIKQWIAKATATIHVDWPSISDEFDNLVAINDWTNLAFLDLAVYGNASPGSAAHREAWEKDMKEVEELQEKILHFLDGLLLLSTKSQPEKTCILFLAADPTDLTRLRLSEEVREIQEKLQLAKLRDNFELQQRMAVRATDISQALLDFQPGIVHFSGHGTAKGELCFETQTGESLPIQPDALAALFEQFTHQVNCVLLNACFSETQARAIAKHIEYVVGMNQAIGDKAAIAFAVGFYQALGGGRTIEDAFKLGCAQMRLQGIPEHLTPVLIRKV